MIARRATAPRRAGEPLPEIGGKGLFTEELERALRDGEIDLAVHSLKDLPTEDADGVVVGAVTRREDVRDCLVARERQSLADLANGAVVGTSSLRRAAQLSALAARPRDPLDPRETSTRAMRKVRDGEYDAAAARGRGRSPARSRARGHGVALARDDAAGARPGRARRSSAVPATSASLARLARVDDAAARAETTAERAFLRALGAGCAAPVAALATVDDDPSRSSPGSRRIRRWRSDGPGRGRGRAARSSASGSRRTRSLPAQTAYWRRSVADQPLAGRRIVVTRPEAKSLADELERLGAEVTLVPLIEIRDAEDRRALADADRALLDLRLDRAHERERRRRGERGARRGSPGRSVAAVGPVTADAIRARGVEPAFVATRASEDIAAGLGELEGKRVLMPQADIAEPALADELRGQGRGGRRRRRLPHGSRRAADVGDPPAPDRRRGRPRERLGRAAASPPPVAREAARCSSASGRRPRRSRARSG